MAAVPYLPQNFLVAPLGTQVNPQAPNIPQQTVSPTLTHSPNQVQPQGANVLPQGFPQNARMSQSFPMSPSLQTRGLQPQTMSAPGSQQSVPQPPSQVQSPLSPTPVNSQRSVQPTPVSSQKSVQPQATVDFSGTYIDNFGDARTMRQLGSNGECSAGWKFTVSGDIATIEGHNISGKFRSGDPIRKIDWTNGVTYKDSQSQVSGQQAQQLPQQQQQQQTQPLPIGTQRMTLGTGALQDTDSLSPKLGSRTPTTAARTSGYGFSTGGSPGSLQVGAYTATGQKPGNPSYMNQDSHLEMNLMEGKILIGVFDGHGSAGTQVSTRVKTLFAEMAPNLATSQDFSGTCHQIFAQVVNRVRGEGMGTDSGATATIALVDPHAQRATIAHCGDSTAIVVNSRSSVVWQSKDHKPSDPQEMQRLQASGTTVNNGRVTLASNPNDHLGLARSIGDFPYEKQGVVGEPDISPSMQFEPGSSLIMGSDGVWDMLSKEEAARILMQTTPQDAAQRIVTTSRATWERGLQQGAHAHIDDITCVLVRFVPNEAS